MIELRLRHFKYWKKNKEDATPLLLPAGGLQ